MWPVAEARPGPVDRPRRLTSNSGTIAQMTLGSRQGTHFLEPDSIRDCDIYADTAFEVLVSCGIGQLTVRALATEMKVTPPAISQKYRREEVFALIVATFGDRYVRWSRAPLHGDLPAQIPRDEVERHGVLVWRALCELARGSAAAGDPTLQMLVAEVRTEERLEVASALGRRLDRDPTPSEVTFAMCLIDGVRTELLSPDPRLSMDEGEQVLCEHVRGLRRLAPDG